jgi:hypothetical protein
MMKAASVLAFLLVSVLGNAAGHGPIFGLATPTNSQGEWSFDSGIFGRSSDVGSQASFRQLIAYGVTPHVTLSSTAPIVIGDTPLTPTRIQPGADFDGTVAWRFHHNTTKVGTRFESTAFAGLVVPGPQSGVKGLFFNSHGPGNMLGAVSGIASRSHYFWLGGTYTKFYESGGERRPDVFDYSLIYGYRPPQWRKEADKWDWRVFGELVGERSTPFLHHSSLLPQTEAHQIFLGPSFLGIFRNYTVSFGAQVPIYRDVGALFPKERVRYALNFSYLLFQHKH